MRLQKVPTKKWISIGKFRYRKFIYKIVSCSVKYASCNNGKFSRMQINEGNNMNAYEKLYSEIAGKALYRFVGLDIFIDLLLRNELSFLHPHTWDDPYEMGFLKSIIRNEINEICKSVIDKGSDFVKLKPILSMKYRLENIYAQCWTMLPESDAMWRIYYNEGKTIRICINSENLKLLNGVFPTVVRYSDLPESLDFTKSDYLHSDYQFYKKMCTKRQAFSHEQEVRLLLNGAYSIKEEDVLYKMFLELYKDSYLKQYNYYITDELETPLLEPVLYNGQLMLIDDYRMEIEKFSPPPIVRVPINVSNIIESVMISPFAPDWYSDTVELLCNQYGIRYSGKSKLYNKRRS